MSLRFPTLSTALVCALGLAVSTARAQAPDDTDATAARSQYNAGTKAFADQRYAEAALAFEAAADAKPSPVALFTAALSWDRTNAPDRAADDYARALALTGLPADKSAQAKDRLALLESMLGALSVSGADGVRVQLDANSERPVPATLHGSSGVHTLTVRAPGGSIDRRSIVLERGKTTTLDLATAPPASSADAHAAPPPPPSSPPSAPAPSPSATSDWKKPVGIAAAGVGGATLLAGILLGVEANDAKNAYDAAPAQATYNHASGLQTWTNVAFIAGGVITAAGVALILWPSHGASEPAKAEVSVLPGGLLVKGAF
jgi:tetratricopeptide (TPR) repeat protein